MRIASALLVLALITGCRQDGPGRPAEDEVVSVERSGSTARDGRVGAAALLRVNGAQPRGPVALELSFIDRKGEELATTRDSLPFCPPRTDCWWGASFFADDYGGDAIHRVRVSVGMVEPFGDDDAPRPFTVRRGEDGVIRGEAPGASGLAYVIASVDGRPRWGTSLNLSGSATVTVPRDLMPSISDEELRGFFYFGSSVPSD